MLMIIWHWFVGANKIFFMDSHHWCMLAYSSYYVFIDHNCVKRKKKSKTILIVLKSCNTAKYLSTEKLFKFKMSISRIMYSSEKLHFYSLFKLFVWFENICSYSKMMH